MKTALYGILAVLIILNSMGMPVFLWFEVEHCKHVIHELDDSQQGSRVLFDPCQTDFELNGTEITYQGRMFDIVETRETNGHAIYVALPDENETLLFSCIRSWQNDHSNSPAASGKSWTHTLKFPCGPALQMPAPVNFLVKNQEIFGSILLPSPFCENFSPPPNTLAI